jgi:TRAP-type C4-dicarboxylate transport system permease small subunit
MQLAVNTLRKHPLSIVFFMLYSWFCYIQVRSHLRFTEASAHINQGERVTWGEGLMYGLLMLIVFSIIFVIITMFLAALRKEQSKFYHALSALIAAVFIITLMFIG